MERTDDRIIYSYNHGGEVYRVLKKRKDGESSSTYNPRSPTRSSTPTDSLPKTRDHVRETSSSAHHMSGSHGYNPESGPHGVSLPSSSRPKPPPPPVISLISERDRSSYDYRHDSRNISPPQRRHGNYNSRYPPEKRSSDERYGDRDRDYNKHRSSRNRRSEYRDHYYRRSSSSENRRHRPRSKSSRHSSKSRSPSNSRLYSPGSAEIPVSANHHCVESPSGVKRLKTEDLNDVQQLTNRNFSETETKPQKFEVPKPTMPLPPIGVIESSLRTSDPQSPEVITIPSSPEDNLEDNLSSDMYSENSVQNGSAMEKLNTLPVPAQFSPIGDSSDELSVASAEAVDNTSKAGSIKGDPKLKSMFKDALLSFHASTCSKSASSSSTVSRISESAENILSTNNAQGTKQPELVHSSKLSTGASSRDKLIALKQKLKSANFRVPPVTNNVSLKPNGFLPSEKNQPNTSSGCNNSLQVSPKKADVSVSISKLPKQRTLPNKHDNEIVIPKKTKNRCENNHHVASISEKEAVNEINKVQTSLLPEAPDRTVGSAKNPIGFPPLKHGVTDIFAEYLSQMTPPEPVYKSAADVLNVLLGNDSPSSNESNMSNSGNHADPENCLSSNNNDLSDLSSIGIQEKENSQPQNQQASVLKDNSCDFDVVSDIGSQCKENEPNSIISTKRKQSHLLETMQQQSLHCESVEPPTLKKKRLEDGNDSTTETSPSLQQSEDESLVNTMISCENSQVEEITESISNSTPELLEDQPEKITQPQTRKNLKVNLTFNEFGEMNPKDTSSSRKTFVCCNNVTDSDEESNLVLSGDLHIRVEEEDTISSSNSPNVAVDICDVEEVLDNNQDIEILEYALTCTENLGAGTPAEISVTDLDAKEANTVSSNCTHDEKETECQDLSSENSSTCLSDTQTHPNDTDTNAEIGEICAATLQSSTSPADTKDANDVDTNITQPTSKTRHADKIAAAEMGEDEVVEATSGEMKNNDICDKTGLHDNVHSPEIQTEADNTQFCYIEENREELTVTDDTVSDELGAEGQEEQNPNNADDGMNIEFNDQNTFEQANHTAAEVSMVRSVHNGGLEADTESSCMEVELLESTTTADTTDNGAFETDDNTEQMALNHSSEQVDSDDANQSSEPNVVHPHAPKIRRSEGTNNFGEENTTVTTAVGNPCNMISTETVISVAGEESNHSAESSQTQSTSEKPGKLVHYSGANKDAIESVTEGLTTSESVRDQSSEAEQSMTPPDSMNSTAGNQVENATTTTTRSASSDYPVLQIQDNSASSPTVFRVSDDKIKSIKIRTDLFQAPQPEEVEETNNDNNTLTNQEKLYQARMKEEVKNLKISFLSMSAKTFIDLKQSMTMWQNDNIDSFDIMEEKLDHLLSAYENWYKEIDTAKVQLHLCRQSLASTPIEVANPSNLDPMKILTVDTMKDYFRLLLHIERCRSVMIPRFSPVNTLQVLRHKICRLLHFNCKRRPTKELNTTLMAVDMLYSQFYESNPDENAPKYTVEHVNRVWDSIRSFSGELDERSIRLDHEQIGPQGFEKKIQYLLNLIKRQQAKNLAERRESGINTAMPVSESTQSSIPDVNSGLNASPGYPVAGTSRPQNPNSVLVASSQCTVFPQNTSRPLQQNTVSIQNNYLRVPTHSTTDSATSALQPRTTTLRVDTADVTVVQPHLATARIPTPSPYALQPVQWRTQNQATALQLPSFDRTFHPSQPEFRVPAVPVSRHQYPSGYNLPQITSSSQSVAYGSQLNTQSLQHVQNQQNFGAQPQTQPSLMQGQAGFPSRQHQAGCQPLSALQVSSQPSHCQAPANISSAQTPQPTNFAQVGTHMVHHTRDIHNSADTVVVASSTSSSSSSFMASVSYAVNGQSVPLFNLPVSGAQGLQRSNPQYRQPQLPQSSQGLQQVQYQQNWEAPNQIQRPCYVRQLQPHTHLQRPVQQLQQMQRHLQPQQPQQQPNVRQQIQLQHVQRQQFQQQNVPVQHLQQQNVLLQPLQQQNVQIQQEQSYRSINPSPGNNNHVSVNQSTCSNPNQLPNPGLVQSSNSSFNSGNISGESSSTTDQEARTSSSGFESNGNTNISAFDHEARTRNEQHAPTNQDEGHFL